MISFDWLSFNDFLDTGHPGNIIIDSFVQEFKNALTLIFYKKTSSEIRERMKAYG